MEFAPQIVKELPTVVMTQERELTKLEVKVLAQPKPQIRWLKANEEIIPSDEFQIENFEDGTSILIINDIYADDSGTITFEAHNAIGAAVTTTELVVEGIQRIVWILLIFECSNALLITYFCFGSFLSFTGFGSIDNLIIFFAIAAKYPFVSIPFIFQLPSKRMKIFSKHITPFQHSPKKLSIAIFTTQNKLIYTARMSTSK